MSVEAIAQAALSGDALAARSLTQDFFRSRPKLMDIASPTVNDPAVLALTAALLELFALRMHQSAPAWTEIVGGLAQPRFLVKSAETMRHLRELCLTQSPEPLRRRNIFVPPNYLEIV